MEKFNAATIAHVTGYSVSTVTSWAAHNKKSVKDGLTVPEILDFFAGAKSRKGSRKSRRKSGREIKNGAGSNGRNRPPV